MVKMLKEDYGAECKLVCRPLLDTILIYRNVYANRTASVRDHSQSSAGLLSAPKAARDGPTFA